MAAEFEIDEEIEIASPVLPCLRELSRRCLYSVVAPFNFAIWTILSAVRFRHQRIDVSQLVSLYDH